jgi:lipopolysaccharide biosynthesis regulator YciM
LIKIDVQRAEAYFVLINLYLKGGENQKAVEIAEAAYKEQEAFNSFHEK